MPLRYYNREAIKAGNWYFAVNCGGCSKPIYTFEDATKGARPMSFVGDGKISVTCPRCFLDGNYQLGGIFSVESREDIPAKRPQRQQISKSQRQPLLQKFRNVKPVFGVGYIEDRPQAAAIIGRAITAWSDIEVQCARLLGELMGISYPATAAVFSSLKNSRTQFDALRAVAKSVLSEKDIDLFDACMSWRASLEKERNDLAHGCFGVSPAIPEGVIWVAQTDAIVFEASYNLDPDAHRIFLSRAAVYDLGILERIAQEIEELYHHLARFIGYLNARNGGQAGEAFRKEQYTELCGQPNIKKALKRLREKKSSTADN